MNLNFGLLTYHADFATSEYFYKVIVNAGGEATRLGAVYPGKTHNASSALSEITKSINLSVLFFVDPPGPFWPVGFEHTKFPMIAYLIDVHQSLNERINYAHFFDYIFVAQKDYVKTFQDAGFTHVYWLPLACDPNIHCIKAPKRDIDVGFVGKLGTKGSQRYNILTQVLSQFNTNDYHRFYSPTEMGKIYGQSKIVFNASINDDLNMRFFEALAAGALLITDRINNGLSDFFQENVHYVGYSSIEEALNKIKYYLEHPLEAQHIAKTGQETVLNNHTYLDRWKYIEKVINSTGKSRDAKIRHYSPIEQAIAYGKVYEQLRLPSGIWKLILNKQYRSAIPTLSKMWIRALIRQINRFIPLTPNAIKARLGY